MGEATFMNSISRTVSVLLDYLFGPNSHSERVEQFWYSPNDALHDANQTLRLDLSRDEITPIVTVITESVRMATAQSVTQRKRSEQRVERSIRSMKSAFRVQIVMHNVMFYLGVSLIMAAVVSAIKGHSLASLVIGGIGVFDLAIFFLKEPVEGLHESVGNLLQLRAAYNSFFAQLDQWQLYFDKVAGAEFLGIKHQITNLIQDSTDHTVQLIHDYTNAGGRNTEKSRIARFFRIAHPKKESNSEVHGSKA
jgi:ABC-type multidrug transport system fused ATPase/permease subunit